MGAYCAHCDGIDPNVAMSACVKAERRGYDRAKSENTCEGCLYASADYDCAEEVPCIYCSRNRADLFTPMKEG